MEYKVDLPYPSLDGVNCDVESASIISPAYSGFNSELNAVLFYSLNEIMLSEQKLSYLAEALEGISITEMIHLKLLGEALIKLGVIPEYKVTLPLGYYYNTSKIKAICSPERIILESIEGEISAISEYEKMIDYLKNEKVISLLKRIILDEKLHISILKELYKKIIEN